jgi:hypothetical protein
VRDAVTLLERLGRTAWHVGANQGHECFGPTSGTRAGFLYPTRMPQTTKAELLSKIVDETRIAGVRSMEAPGMGLTDETAHAVESDRTT